MAFPIPRLSLVVGTCLLLASADASLAQRPINPVVLAPSARNALPRQAMLIDGSWAGPLEQFFNMEDWLPLLGMLGVLPLERDSAFAPANLAGWMALYERHALPARRLAANRRAPLATKQ